MAPPRSATFESPTSWPPLEGGSPGHDPTPLSPAPDYVRVTAFEALVWGVALMVLGGVGAAGLGRDVFLPPLRECATHALNCTRTLPSVHSDLNAMQLSLAKEFARGRSDCANFEASVASLRSVVRHAFADQRSEDDATQVGIACSALLFLLVSALILVSIWEVKENLAKALRLQTANSRDSRSTTRPDEPVALGAQPRAADELFPDATGRGPERFRPGADAPSGGGAVGAHGGPPRSSTAESKGECPRAWVSDCPSPRAPAGASGPG
jgi:hypothetical protein